MACFSACRFEAMNSGLDAVLPLAIQQVDKNSFFSLPAGGATAQICFLTCILAPPGWGGGRCRVGHGKCPIFPWRWASPLYPGRLSLRAPRLWCKVTGGRWSSLHLLLENSCQCAVLSEAASESAFCRGAGNGRCSVGGHLAVPRFGQSPLRPECGLCTPLPTV